MVTDGNVQTTICQAGWINANLPRPPVSVTNKLKIFGIAAYGYRDTNLADYEEDHLIPRELGGTSDPSNLWPEPNASPNQKDGVEAHLHSLVCYGAMTLTAAQIIMRTNWTKGLKL